MTEPPRPAESPSDALHPGAGALVSPAPIAPAYARGTEIAIAWDYLMQRREITLLHAPTLPKYLLLPEVAAILRNTLKDNPNLMIDMLWHTGARVSEMLAITPAHLWLKSPEDAFVSLETLKQPKMGRPKKTAPPRGPVRRMVPLADPLFIDRLRRYLASQGLGKHDRLFPISATAVDQRIKRASAGVKLPFVPSSRTFRHSFAVNAVLHACPMRAIQLWLGHKCLVSTEIYAAVLGSETNHFMAHVRYGESAWRAGDVSADEIVGTLLPPESKQP